MGLVIKRYNTGFYGAYIDRCLVATIESSEFREWEPGSGWAVTIAPWAVSEVSIIFATLCESKGYLASCDTILLDCIEITREQLSEELDWSVERPYNKMRI